jgi:hypothetical protein
MKILSNYEFCYFINFAESGIIALKMVLPEDIKEKIQAGKEKKWKLRGILHK